MTKKEMVTVALLFLTAIIWGGGFIASKIALDANVTPELLMVVRFCLATVLLAVVFYKRLKSNLHRGLLLRGFLLGVMLYLGFYLQNVALLFTTPANNAFLTSANVIMVPFIVWAITKRMPNIRKIVACVVFIVGIFILSMDISQGISFSAGDSLTLLCAFFFACHIAYNGKLAKSIDTVTLVFLQVATSALLSLIVFIVVDRDMSPLMTPNGLLPLVFLGLFSTFVCYLLQTFCQSRMASPQVAIILGTEALFGAMFSVILGYDPLSYNIVVGGGIMLFSVFLAEWSGAPKKVK